MRYSTLAMMIGAIFIVGWIISQSSNTASLQRTLIAIGINVRTVDEDTCHRFAKQLELTKYICGQDGR